MATESDTSPEVAPERSSGVRENPGPDNVKPEEKETPKELPPQVGRRIYGIRKARHLTLCDVQKMSGISISVLSQIERGKVNPNFSTLWQLTHSLGIDFAELLERATGGASRAQIVERVDAQSMPTIRGREDKCIFRVLNPPRVELPVEWYEIELAAGVEVAADARGDGAREHLTVTRGRMEIELDDNPTRLKEGETAHFLTKLPHKIRNLSSRTSKALLVVMSPFELQSAGYSHYRIDRC